MRPFKAAVVQITLLKQVYCDGGELRSHINVSPEAVTVLIVVCLL